MFTVSLKSTFTTRPAIYVYANSIISISALWKSRLSSSAQQFCVRYAQAKREEIIGATLTMFRSTSRTSIFRLEAS